MLHAQIICSRSFVHKVMDYELVRQSVCAFAERAAEKLREEKQYCRLVTLWVQSSHFSHHEPYYYRQETQALIYPTQDTREIIQAAVSLFEQLLLPNVKCSKSGILLSEFSPSGQVQLNLFENRHSFRKSGELMRTIDQINHGKNAIWFAGQGIQAQSALWKMKQQFLSPRWTTQLSDIPVVKCQLSGGVFLTTFDIHSLIKLLPLLLTSLFQVIHCFCGYAFFELWGNGFVLALSQA